MAKDQYEFRFLVAKSNWPEVKAVFKDDLGITKDKEDDSVIDAKSHYVVKLTLDINELTEHFYENIRKSIYVTIISDGYSQKVGGEVREYIRDIEVELRELGVYAYDIAKTYEKIITAKRGEAKDLIKKGVMVSDGNLDPLLSFFDFGELIEFYSQTANEVDDSDLAHEVALLIENSSSFEDFKSVYIKKFKKLSVWDTLSKTLLVESSDWPSVRAKLNRLKEIRNSALHFRVLTPNDLKDAHSIHAELNKLLRKKKRPATIDTERMEKTLNAINQSMTSYQKAIETLVNNSVQPQLNEAIKALQRSVLPVTPNLSILNSLLTPTSNSEPSASRVDEVEDTDTKKNKIQPDDEEIDEGQAK